MASHYQCQREDFVTAGDQRELLEAEGIRFENGKVDFDGVSLGFRLTRRRVEVYLACQDFQLSKSLFQTDKHLSSYGLPR